MLPRRFWVLVGWVIGLSTLAVAAGVAEQTYTDLYAIADCAAPAAAPFYETCRDFRLLQGVAAIGGALVKVPALGLALVAAAIAWISRREGRHVEVDRPQGDGGKAGRSSTGGKEGRPAKGTPATGPAVVSGAASAPGGDGTTVQWRKEGKARRTRRSKGPSTPVINASNG